MGWFGNSVYSVYYVQGGASGITICIISFAKHGRSVVGIPLSLTLFLQDLSSKSASLACIHACSSLTSSYTSMTSFTVEVHSFIPFSIQVTPSSSEWMSEDFFENSEERSVIREVCSDNNMSFRVVSMTGWPEVGKDAMDEYKAWLERRGLKA